MSTKISIHKGLDGSDKVDFVSNTYDESTGSAIRFHTIDISYGGSSVVLFMMDDESLVNALNSIIDSAKAKLDTMMVSVS